MTRFFVGLVFLTRFLLISLVAFAANAEDDVRQVNANFSIDSSTSSINSPPKKCLFVMSYHQGYEWNDGIDKGVTEKLTGVCQLKKIYLDTKRNTSVEYGKAAALKAKAVVEQYKPDVLIVSDDNASRYLAMPYFKDKSLPIVFSGLNWTASEYGYPYKNATGMVEVAPLLPLLKNIQRSIGLVKQGAYLSSDVITEHKDFLRYKDDYLERGVNLTPMFVSTMAEWKKAYLKAQKFDFIIMNNNAGINDWDEDEMARFVIENGHTLTVTNYRWMMSYAMLGMTKSPVEQGEWAGDVAAAILAGLPVQDIPITINKSWFLFVNQDLLTAANILLSNRVLNHAYKTW